MRRAATQCIKWMKQSGAEAVENLEEFLGRPLEHCGNRRKSGSMRESLPTTCVIETPISDFKRVFTHFEGKPPPLAKAIAEEADGSRPLSHRMSGKLGSDPNS